MKNLRKAEVEPGRGWGLGKTKKLRVLGVHRDGQKLGYKKAGKGRVWWKGRTQNTSRGNRKKVERGEPEGKMENGSGLNKEREGIRAGGKTSGGRTAAFSVDRGSK